MSDGPTVTLSAETVRWVERAVEGYDPLLATPAENTPEKLACWAVYGAIRRATTEPEGGDE